MIDVHDIEGTQNHTPATDYEYIDDTKPTLPPSDMFVNSMHDYSRTPDPSTYEVPLQTTMPKVSALHKLKFFRIDLVLGLIRKAQLF